MDTLRWILGVLALLVLLVWLAGRFGALRGHQPADIGVREGRLKPPSRTPNSVSSQADLYPEHPMREYARIAAAARPAAARRPRSRACVRWSSECRARRWSNSATTTSTRSSKPLTLRFVDDVEFWYDPAAQAIAVRSASRIGRKDFGVNRARIEAIRGQLLH